MYKILLYHAVALLSLRAASAFPSPAAEATSIPEPADMLTRYSAETSPGKLAPNQWTSWGDISSLYVFGASYAFTGRFSNPPIQHPSLNGFFNTSCNGYNYVDRLVLRYNKAHKIAVNMKAWSGAPAKSGFSQQVEAFTKETKEAAFQKVDSAQSLFHAEFGINDINTAGENYAKEKASIFTAYHDSIDKLYQLGARNFLIVNVPAIDRSPKAKTAGAETIAMWKTNVKDFNDAIVSMVEGFNKDNAHNDATFFIFDNNALFNQVLDAINDAKDVPDQTKVYQKDTLFEICSAYADHGDSVAKIDQDDPSCKHSVNEYFWLSGYHPTYPLHDLMAQRIADGLEKMKS